MAVKGGENLLMNGDILGNNRKREMHNLVKERKEPKQEKLGAYFSLLGG